MNGPWREVVGIAERLSCGHYIPAKSLTLRKRKRRCEACLTGEKPATIPAGMNEEYKRLTRLLDVMEKVLREKGFYKVYGLLGGLNEQDRLGSESSRPGVPEPGTAPREGE